MNQRVQQRSEADVFANQEFDEGGVGTRSAVIPAGRSMPAARADETQIHTMGELVTAQRVAVKRDMAEIRAEIKALAAMAGMRWVYRIPFKNRTKGTTEYVEGPTVKCTNSVFRAYGNCLLTTRVFTEGDSWIFYSRIVDLQKGSTYDRPFQQRKGQDTGMSDKARAGDMIFQIGVSKSQRNVVANFLEDLVAYAQEEAKKGVIERVNKNPGGAREWILAQLLELEIDVKRVEVIYGRTKEHWTVPDMAKMFAEINGIQDGMIDATDIYPMPEDKNAKRAESNPLAGGQEKTDKNAGADAGANEQAGGAAGQVASGAAASGSPSSPGNTPENAGSGVPADAATGGATTATGTGAPPTPAREPSVGPSPVGAKKPAVKKNVFGGDA